MIEGPQEILLGRKERTTEDNFVARQYVQRWVSRGRWLYQFRYGKDEERMKEFEEWNAVRLAGRFGCWGMMSFEVWEGLGSKPLPVLRRAYLFKMGEDKIDRVDMKESKLPVLVGAQKIWHLPEPRYGALEEALRREGISCDPRCRTLDGLDRVISEAGFELSGWDLLPFNTLSAKSVREIDL